MGQRVAFARFFGGGYKVTRFISTSGRTEKFTAKSPLKFPKAGFSNMAPLTGIAFASNWLKNKLNLNSISVKTTRMTTNGCGLNKSGLSNPRNVVIVTMA